MLLVDKKYRGDIEGKGLWALLLTLAGSAALFLVSSDKAIVELNRSLAWASIYRVYAIGYRYEPLML